MKLGWLWQWDFISTLELETDCNGCAESEYSCSALISSPCALANLRIFFLSPQFHKAALITNEPLSSIQQRIAVLLFPFRSCPLDRSSSKQWEEMGLLGGVLMFCKLQVVCVFLLIALSSWPLW